MGFDAGSGVAIGRAWPTSSASAPATQLTLVAPAGAVTPMGMTPRIKTYRSWRSSRSACRNTTRLRVHAAHRGAGLFQCRRRCVSRSRSIRQCRRSTTYRQGRSEAASRPIFIVDWRQRNATFFSALQVERNVMFMILTLIVLVAALNIISGLIMLVKDKGSDIAILRTMGATSGSIMRIFFMTGAAIGTVGTFAGVLLGVVVCLNVESIRQFFSWLSGTTLFNPELYFLSQLPADMNAGETVSVIVMALALSFLATIFPAWRASKLDPVQALRYE
jgi:lipoprotein-releasing system permease protein